MNVVQVLRKSYLYSYGQWTLPPIVTCLLYSLFCCSGWEWCSRGSDFEERYVSLVSLCSLYIVLGKFRNLVALLICMAWYSWIWSLFVYIPSSVLYLSKHLITHKCLRIAFRWSYEWHDWISFFLVQMTTSLRMSTFHSQPTSQSHEDFKLTGIRR